VLFFVSVGMLFDPGIVMRRPVAVVATLLIIVIGKSLGAWFLVWMLGYPRRTALTISVSLAQIGEFAFMLTEMSVGTGLFPPEGRNLVLASAILSIIINPFLFAALNRFEPQKDQAKRARQPPISVKDHVILIGHGRVGKLVSRALRDAGRSLVVIEENPAIIEELQAAGINAILGRAETDGILESANVTHAHLLLPAIPNVFEAGQVVERARLMNPSLAIIARAHSDAEEQHLAGHGADMVIMGEREIARRMIESAIDRNERLQL
jgi:CPA2 family monovalent cation:H+ antiporter-2